MVHVLYRREYELIEATFRRGSPNNPSSTPVSADEAYATHIARDWEDEQVTCCASAWPAKSLNLISHRHRRRGDPPGIPDPAEELDAFNDHIDGPSEAIARFAQP